MAAHFFPRQVTSTYIYIIVTGKKKSRENKTANIWENDELVVYP